MTSPPNPAALSFAGVPFSSPLVAVSGTAGYAADFLPLTTPNAWGAITLKGLTPKPKKGNPSPRVTETPGGFLNAIGLQNEGFDYFLQRTAPRLAAPPFDTIHPIVNIAANTIKEFAALVSKLATLPQVTFIELNVSCPNISYGGREFGSDLSLLSELVSECAKGKKDKRLLVKLSPNDVKVSDFAQAAAQHGADGLTLVNTFRALRIDPLSRKPLLSSITGGYSGPAIKPLVLALVYQTAQVVDLPLIAVGGVNSAYDVVEYLLAGASLVGIGTANLIDPRRVGKIYRDYQRYLKKHGLTTEALSGAMEV